MKNWIKYCDKDINNMVLSSRIRLARNIDNINFPNRLNEEKGREVVKLVEESLSKDLNTKENYKSVYLWKEDNLNKKIFLEKHLISNKLLSNYAKSACILDNDETVSIMINEEDHIRIQCITCGFNLEEANSVANKIDDILEENITYAFNEKLGYLTACPTNIGTGLRASIMIHLPVLTMKNEMSGVLNVLSQVGMTIRGLYGEGSKVLGNLYQISNQLSLGLSEEEILNNLKAVVSQIINQERIAREKFIKNYRYEVEDKVYRSLGILKSAVLLNLVETLNLLSNVRLGVEMGIIKNIALSKLNELLIDIQSPMLQRLYGDKFNNKEEKLIRAKLVRDKLNLIDN